MPLNTKPKNQPPLSGANIMANILAIRQPVNQDDQPPYESNGNESNAAAKISKSKD